MNANAARALVLGVAAIAAYGVKLGFYDGIGIVEYQAQCNKLHAMHDLLIGAVDPSLGFTDGEARRTAEQAALNAHKGTGIANSLHINGLARDKFLTIDKKVTFKATDYLQAGVLWEELGKGYGVPAAWGGRFKSVDAVHFSCAWKSVK
jgi:hypothetical protein